MTTLDIRESIQQAGETTLTEREADRLERFEARIEANLKAFYAVGETLITIRDERLYRGTHSTFEAYCAAKWKLSKSYAYGLMQAAEVVADITAGTVTDAGEDTGNTDSAETSAIADKASTSPSTVSPANAVAAKPVALPANEAQTRELARLPADKRAEAWETVTTLHGNDITAAKVKAVVDTYFPPAGASLPEDTEALPPLAWARDAGGRAFVDVDAQWLNAVGEATYSGDTLPSGKMRGLFSYNNRSFVMTSGVGTGATGYSTVWAYEAVPLNDYRGTAVPYKVRNEQFDGTDAMRVNFYDGVIARYREQTYVLRGPQVAFNALLSPLPQPEVQEPAGGETEQATLGQATATVEPPAAEAQEVSPGTFEQFVAADSQMLLRSGQIAPPTFLGNMWTVTRVWASATPPSVIAVRVWDMDAYIDAGLPQTTPIIDFADWKVQVTEGKRRALDFAGLKVTVSPTPTKRDQPLWYILTEEAKRFERRDYTPEEAANIARLRAKAAPEGELDGSAASAQALNTERLDYPTDEVGMAALRRTQSTGPLPYLRIKSPVLLDGQLWTARTLERDLDNLRDIAFCLQVIERQDYASTPVTGSLWQARVQQGERSQEDVTGLMVLGENGKSYVFTGVIRRYEHQGAAETSTPLARLEAAARVSSEEPFAFEDMLPADVQGVSAPVGGVIERLNSHFREVMDAHPGLLEYTLQDVPQQNRQPLSSTPLGFLMFWKPVLEAMARSSSLLTGLGGIMVAGDDMRLLQALAARPRPGQTETPSTLDYLHDLLEQTAAQAGLELEGV